MPIESDIVINQASFSPDKIPEDTEKLNNFLKAIGTKGPRWFEVGAANYRELREQGKTPLPVPVYLPGAKDEDIPSRDQGRNIPLRVYRPDNGKPSTGIFLHFHGGGFVLSSHTQQDNVLQRYANHCQLTAISVGYSLAPENTFPSAFNDACDAAEYLVDHSEATYGAKVVFISGESAGACLAALAAFHLVRARPSHRLAGLIFPFGHFDLTLGMPSITSATYSPIVINLEAMQQFTDAYTPGMSLQERRNPQLSPLYEKLQELASTSPSKTLPPALFLCGTQDALLDDTLLMSVKWMATGSEAVVKIYPGAPHGFTALPGLKAAEEAIAVELQFAKEKLDAYLGAAQSTWTGVDDIGSQNSKG